MVYKAVKKDFHTTYGFYFHSLQARLRDSPKISQLLSIWDSSSVFLIPSSSQQARAPTLASFGCP